MKIKNFFLTCLVSCVLLLGFISNNAYAKNNDYSVVEDALTGAAYLDSSINGQVAFHYPFYLCNQEKLVLSYNQNHETFNDYSGIGEGWYFDIPHLHITDKQMKLHINGKIYNIYSDALNSYSIQDYPVKYVFSYTAENLTFTLATAYETYTFNDEGFLLNVKIPNDVNGCVYSYENGVLARIDFDSDEYVIINRHLEKATVTEYCKGTERKLAVLGFSENEKKNYLIQIDATYGASFKTEENPTGEIINFNYVTPCSDVILLNEYSINNDCCVELEYCIDQGRNLLREKKTFYSDGMCGTRKYSYSNGLLNTILIDDDWKESYSYSINDTFTVEKSVEYGGNTSVYRDSYNAGGQLIACDMPEGNVRFFYDENGKLIREITNDYRIDYGYDNTGKVVNANSSPFVESLLTQGSTALNTMLRHIKNMYITAVIIQAQVVIG